MPFTKAEPKACKMREVRVDTVHEPSLLPAEKNWKLVWSDEFDGSGPLNTEVWKAEHGFVRNEEYQYYYEQQPHRRAAPDDLACFRAGMGVHHERQALHAEIRAQERAFPAWPRRHHYRCRRRVDCRTYTG